MRRSLAASVMSAVLVAGCGGSTPAESAAPLTGDPVLAPLAPGSRWTYSVADPLRGTFTKSVEVVGTEPVPDSSATAVRIRDVEPTQEETSWETVQDGFLVRLREEDRKAGVLVRTTSWSPPAPKAIAVNPPAGYTATITVREREWNSATGTTAEKDQTYSFSVVALDVPITVPAGTFRCVEVQRQRLDKAEPRRTYWLAPGVGKVRETGERTEELVSFTPGA